MRIPGISEEQGTKSDVEIPFPALSSSTYLGCARVGGFGIFGIFALLLRSSGKFTRKLGLPLFQHGARARARRGTRIASLGDFDAQTEKSCVLTTRGQWPYIPASTRAMRNRYLGLYDLNYPSKYITPNDLGGHLTSDLTSATLITLVSMCILPLTASEAMATSKLPQRLFGGRRHGLGGH